MGACSQCQSNVPPGALQCPHCGATQVGAFDVPDLDLPVAPPSQPKIKPKAKPSRSAPDLSLDVSTAPRNSQPPPNFQQNLPALDDEQSLGTSGLELAVAPIKPVSVRPPALSPSAGTPPKVALERPSVPPPRRQAPPLDDSVSSPDLYEVQQVARFGPLPAFPWESVLYTIRVVSRVREMKQELAQAEEEFRSLEKSADDAVTTFLDRSYETLIKDATFARMFEPIREMQARYLERVAQIDALDQEGRNELLKIDEEVGRCERLAQEGRSTKEGLSSEAARLYEASREGDTLAAQLLENIREQMNKADEEATQALGLMNDLRRRRRDVEQGYIARIRELENALVESDGPRKKELLEIGRSILERKSALEGEGFGAIELSRKRLQEGKHRCGLLKAALTSYDRKKVQEGVLYLLGSLLLLVGAVVLGVMRMNRELSAPPPSLPPM